MLTLALHPIVVGVLVVFFVLISGLVILTILIQKPQGGGLSGAFGSGAGSGQTAFGAKTGDALTIATIGMFVVWVIFAVGLNFAVRPTQAAPGTKAVAPGNAPAGESGGEPAKDSGETKPAAPANDAPAPAPAAPAGGSPEKPAEKPAEPQPAPAQPSPAPPPSGGGGGG